MSAALTVWLLNPYHTGSHRAWAEGYAAHSRHRVRVLAMPGQFWKWRMLGGALELAAQAQAQLATGERPDVLWASSMTNLPAFLALTRPALTAVPVVLYMHENQLTYPLVPGTKRDLVYGTIQHLAMLAADRVCFNSAYHLRAWFDEVPRLLKHFPDYTHLDTIAAVRHRAQVLPVGCDLRRLDEPETGPDVAAAPADYVRRAAGQPPLILWNQRWEHDKAPEAMLAALYALADEGVPFRVALAGENFRVQPAEFAEAQARLGDRVVHFGYAASDADYARLLRSAHIVVSTAIHEFFGVGVVEAIYCGARPVLPNRLSYPELLPPDARATCLYDDFAGLLAGLRTALADPWGNPAWRSHVAQFDWRVQAPVYDRLVEEMAGWLTGTRDC